jgi:toluene monooxygenase system ferredoxin subunit
METWHAAIDLDEIREDELTSRVIDGVGILLVNIGGRILSFRDRCPHAGTPLHLGSLEGTVLTCSTHLWQFDLANGGAGVNPKNCSLIALPVRIDAGKVLVEIGGHHHRH